MTEAMKQKSPIKAILVMLNMIAGGDSSSACRCEGCGGGSRMLVGKATLLIRLRFRMMASPSI